MNSRIPRTLELLLAFAAGAATLCSQSPAPTPAPGAVQSPRERAWSILNMGVTEKSVDKRTLAVRAAGLIPRNPHAVEIAEHAGADERPEVRAAAATALGQMQSTVSIPKLKDALRDKEASVV